MGEAPSTPDANARNWATICHLSGLLILSGAPFGNILGPLFVYLIKKDDHPFIAVAGRESLNFQIFASIIGFILFIAYISFFVFDIVFFTHVGAAHVHNPMLFPMVPLLFWPCFFVLVIFDLVNVIIAAVHTSKGEAYLYPITLRFVRER